MTDMSDVSDVIDVVDPADSSDIPDPVSRALAIRVRPETLEITEVLDKVACGEDGKAITTISPLAFPLNDLQLAALRSEFDGVGFKVEKPDGKAAAKKVLARLTALKASMEDAYKTWNAPILELTKHARTQRDYAVSEIDKIREPIKKAIDEQTARENEERNRKAVLESKRISEHTCALKVLTDMPSNYVQASSAEIEAVIREISSFEYLSRRNWEEYHPAATDAVRVNVEALQNHLVNAKAREELARMQAEQRAADEKRAQEQAEQDAERERIEALRERIHNIELAPTTAVGRDSAGVQKVLDRLNAVDLAAFGDLAADAASAIITARTGLTTMLEMVQKAEAAQQQAEQDAAELAAFRASAAKVKKDAQDEAERVEFERVEREQQAAREKEEVARQARERAEAAAEALRDLLIEARAYVPAGDLADRIDAQIATVTGA